MRADQLLVSQGLAPTRSAAQRLIERGAVRWRGPAGWATPRKAGENLPEGCEIEVTDDAELRWVSRGGLKLEAALTRCALAPAGMQCLDVGQSTGGFSDVLLSRDAGHVIGVDVGHGQLHAKLKSHARLTAIEGVNARQLCAADLGSAMPTAGFDLIVGDLSFISLTLVLPALRPLLANQGQILMLVKPQFELQPQAIAKGGLVRDASSYVEVEQRIRTACENLTLTVRDYFASAIEGGDGNREFFVWAQAQTAQGVC